MTALFEAHAAHFRKQADWCEALGSPFNAALLRGFAARIGNGAVLDGLLAGGEAPLSAEAADAGPLRVAGALHGLVLSGRDAALAAQYPAARADWDMDAVLPVAYDALNAHTDWVAAFLKNPPQTNETRRSIALLASFSRLEGPLHLLEPGASAGLNQHWDAFGYDGGTWQRAGDAGAPIMTADWTGPPPDLPDQFEIASRRACDRAPLDITSDADCLALKSYIWPDQTDRLARIDGAIAIARQRGVAVDSADAADWLEARLAGPLLAGTTVIFHSIAWQYFDCDTHARAMSAIEAAGARADAAHRLAWVRFEHENVFGGQKKRHIVDRVMWPGGARTIDAVADPHAHRVEVLSGH